MSDFGTLKHPKRAKQIIVFEGISSDGIEATDIDGLIEYRNKGYLIYEVKYRDARMPFGQRLALERMVKDYTKSGKEAIAMVVEHNVEDVDKPILIRNCVVREIYCSGEKRWSTPNETMTAKQLTDIFIRGLNEKYSLK